MGSNNAVLVHIEEYALDNDSDGVSVVPGLQPIVGGQGHRGGRHKREVKRTQLSRAWSSWKMRPDTCAPKKLVSPKKAILYAHTP